MNPSLPRVTVRSSALAVLVAASSLFLGGCATQLGNSVTSVPVSDSKESNEKPVTYAELHRMMAKLAEGPGLAQTSSGTAAGFVAANP